MDFRIVGGPAQPNGPNEPRHGDMIAQDGGRDGSIRMLAGSISDVTIALRTSDHEVTPGGTGPSTFHGQPPLGSPKAA
jgi:hypothetical protein